MTYIYNSLDSAVATVVLSADSNTWDDENILDIDGGGHVYKIM